LIFISEKINLFLKPEDINPMRFIYIISLTFFFSFYAWGQNLPEEKKTSFDENFFEAMNYRIKGNYQKSNEFFFNCLEINPHSDVSLFKIAENYSDLKNYTQAEEYLQRALEINPDNKWYKHTLILIKIKKGEEPDKIKKLIEDFRPFAKNKYLVASLYRMLYKEEYTQKATTKNEKESPQKTVDLNEMLNKKQYTQLIEEGEKLLEKTPDNPLLYYQVALAFYHLKKPEDALEYLDMGMDFVLNNKNLLKQYYHLYAQIYLEKGNTQKSRYYKLKLEKL
jgi:tetratricopeptide (TPR) repeat protein